MNTLTNLILTLAALIPTSTAVETPAVLADSPAAQVTTVDTNLQAQTRLDWVISPWGYRDLYVVHHGWNRLICSGTGLAFSYFAY